MIVTCPHCRKKVALKGMKEKNIKGKKITYGYCPYCQSVIYINKTK